MLLTIYTCHTTWNTVEIYTVFHNTLVKYVKQAYMELIMHSLFFQVCTVVPN